MDYRALLKKYIEHVGTYEGSTFLSDHKRSAYPDMPTFTDEEWALLKHISEEGDDPPLEIELPKKIKPLNENEVIIHIGGQPQIFYKE